MIPTLGLITLILALVASFALAISPFITYRNTRLAPISFWLSAIVFFCLAISFLCLMISYITSDFSVLNVAMNSHTSKPLLYKITGTWGNHEGSMLLWVVSIALFTVIFAWKSNFSLPLRSITLSVQGALLAGFLLFILITSNPFIRIFPVPEHGVGLNPLLQDIGLALHPPMLYLGYVGFSISFSAAIALLFIPRENASLWAKQLKPWVLASWSFLTLGIGLGSWWAYRELGWGGFWFWDPVENASLMPWLAATALVHSLLVLEKRDTLKRWSVLLALITFSLSLLGTFLVRSGVLTSVHAFATDPARGIFILVLLFLVIGFSLTLFSLRSHRLQGTATFQAVSRETFLLLNNLLLLTACATVLLGTLYPLLLEVVSTARISVGPPYFSTMFTILTMPALILATIAPLLNWRNDHLTKLFRLCALPTFCIIFSVVLLWWMELQASPQTMVMLALSLWLIISIILFITKRIQLFHTSLSHSFSLLLSLPNRSKAMVLAHLGVGILALSITITNQWQQEQEKVMEIGHAQHIGPYTITLSKIDYAQEKNFLARRATFTVHKANQEITSLHPETRYYPVEKKQTPESAIYYTLLSNLYIAIGEIDDTGHIAVRSYYKPFINGIWIGSILMVIGMILPVFRKRTPEG